MPYTGLVSYSSEHESAMDVAATNAATSRSASRTSSRAASLAAGLMVVAVAPTMFWSALIALVAWTVERPLSVQSTALMAGVMFAFLTCIWAGFVAARD